MIACCNEQDMDKWGSSKLPGRNESAWRAGAPPGRGVARGSEWNARRGRGAPPQAPGKGTPPPGFDGPPGFPTKPVRSQAKALLHNDCRRHTRQKMCCNDHAMQSVRW